MPQVEPPHRVATPALTLSDELATVTDDYKTAIVNAAQAENVYNHAYSSAFLAARDVAATVRPKTAENQPEVVEARSLWRIAEANERTLRVAAKSLETRIMAELGHQRFIREQT